MIFIYCLILYRLCSEASVAVGSGTCLSVLFEGLRSAQTKALRRLSIIMQADSMFLLEWCMQELLYSTEDKPGQL